MQPERNLIILCSQTSVGEKDREQIQSVLQSPVDFELVKRVAGRNGLLPLVGQTLTDSFSGFLPAEESEFFRNYLIRHTGSNLRLTSKMIEIVGALEAESIDVLPFKGPSLAQQVYGNLAFRDYVDLDLMVQPKDFEKSVEILLSNSFTPISSSAGEHGRHLPVRGGKDISLWSPDREYRVELHWKLSGSHFALPYEIEDLWKRMRTLELGGRSVRALDVNDLIVYLCLHGSRHKWEKFAWVTDVNELVRRLNEDGADWRAIRDRALEARCERILDLGYFLIERFYGTRPSSTRELDKAAVSAFGKIADEIGETDFSRDFQSTELAQWYVYHLSLKDTVGDRLRLHYHYLVRYLRLIVRPGALDREIFRLPRGLYPLYYLLRPIRLLFDRVKKRED